MPHGNVLLRQRQYAVAAEPEAALRVARRLVTSKIRNQRHLLRRNAERDGVEMPAELSAALRQMSVAATDAADAGDLATLMGCEGSAAHAYFGQRGPAVNCNEHGRKKLITCYERRMDALVTHPVLGYRISYRRVFEVQARLLARHLQGEIAELPSVEVR